MPSPRRYFGIELGVVQADYGFVGQFPYGTIPHPMILGQVRAHRRPCALHIIVGLYSTTSMVTNNSLGSTLLSFLRPVIQAPR